MRLWDVTLEVKVSFPKKRWIVLAVLVFIFGILPFALEPFVEKYVNRKLAEMEVYTGSIQDVDIQLYRGAYRIDGIEIIKRGTDDLPPLFTCKSVDLSVLWKALFKGKVVSEIVLETPVVTMVDGESNEKSQTGTNSDWKELVKSLLPIQINRFAIQNGSAKLDSGANKKATITAAAINGEVLGLSNSGEGAAKGSYTMTVQESGQTELSFTLDPFAEAPTFDLNFKLQSLNLTDVEAFTRQYARVDFDSGTLDVALEVKADSGKLNGYLKPIFKDAKTLSFQQDVKEDKDSPLRLVWEGIVGVFTKPVENQPEQQLATRIPIGGTVDEVKTNLFAAIGALIKNAYGEPLTASLENSVE